MTNKFMSKRWALTAAKATAVAMALGATVGATGAAAADAASVSSVTPTHSVAAPAGSVLVKEVKTAQGTVDIYRDSAAGVRPFSASGCAGGSFEVCININGSGRFVYYIENSTHFPSAGTVNMEINGPSGVIAQTGNFYESGGWYSVVWNFDYNVTPGYYCATSFTYTSRQGACETVS
ncbi:hypothetical protein J2Z21_008215 [Streptomyces griseochromogenes]|uniref:Secreted protein n=1 Tax=Streptomyces griseochromogenes TaxID=68214 RepID=A0A1B1B001_9ACTN|nr:hypothetical protein [Streptomyces griseochromogenes]ANP52148.1 hypothetical protein AVL59_23610 [Streptomyces griseochromogenes]MBP2055202.1 hypothetical protein [Streptomyces griseochromogenes]